MRESSEKTGETRGCDPNDVFYNDTNDKESLSPPLLSLLHGPAWTHDYSVSVNVSLDSVD
jgi:hypothetical protein